MPAMKNMLYLCGERHERTTYSDGRHAFSDGLSVSKHVINTHKKRCGYEENI